MKLRVKVAAGAFGDGIVGWMGDTLKVRVRARREKGKANAALGRLLSDVLELPTERIRVVSGLTATTKLVEIADTDRSTVLDRLNRILPKE